MAWEPFFGKDGRPPDRQAFVHYFEDRYDYSVEAGTQGCAANYVNESSGVYFSVGWMPDVCQLRLNYVRPEFFGFEAAIELQDFVDTLGLAFAPEDDPDAWRPFDADAFLDEWIRLNDAAIEEIRADHPDALAEMVFLPRADLRSIWLWNYYGPDALATFIDDYANPTVSPVSAYRVNGRPAYLMTLSDRFAIAVPDIATGIALVREGDGKADDDIRLVHRTEFAAATAGLGRRLEEFDATVFDAPSAPDASAALARLFDQAPRLDDFDIERIPFEQILDADPATDS